MSQPVYRYNFPTTVYFGVGARKKLPDSLKEAGVARPLVVTDRGLAKLPVIAELTALLTGAGLDPQIFSDIWGNPIKSQVIAGAQALKAGKRDSIVAVGGGAALDVAKVIGLMAHHPGDLFDYEDDKPGARPVDQPIPFIVALPTTAGTGSEVGRSAVVSDDVTHAKKIIFDPKLLPQRVFADPELTLGLPAEMTAATGMDAVTHLAEAYLAKGFQPLCDGIALEGLRLANHSLARCVEFARAKTGATEAHLEARGMMLNAALMGAVAFQKGLGVTHSCAHALSTVCDLHHGLVNGILIPYTLAFNVPVARERFDILAQTVGAHGAEGFIAWLTQLKASLKIPVHLKDVGVTAAQVPALVDCAVGDGCHQNNPRPVSRADFTQLFTEALG